MKSMSFTYTYVYIQKIIYRDIQKRGTMDQLSRICILAPRSKVVPPTVGWTIGGTMVPLSVGRPIGGTMVPPTEIYIGP